MSDIKKLQELSVGDLLQELRDREAKAGNERLREFDDESVSKVLKENQKVSTE